MNRNKIIKTNEIISTFKELSQIFIVLWWLMIKMITFSINLFINSCDETIDISTNCEQISVNVDILTLGRQLGFDMSESTAICETVSKYEKVDTKLPIVSFVWQILLIWFLYIKNKKTWLHNGISMHFCQKWQSKLIIFILFPLN